jgi:threonine dehydrogenase-like Zn-dependent dehydrogenase
MVREVIAAVRTGPKRTELQAFPFPEVPDDGAVMKVEAAGICGTDVKMYAKPPFESPVIMGHENIGVLEEAGPKFLERHGLSIGDRLFVEHYVGCFRCSWCHRGDYRHCEATDWRTNPDARRYGYTSCLNEHHLWGGFAQYLYLPWNAVIHRVPDGVSPKLASIVTPLSNGIEWAIFEAGVGYDSTVLIQGPGQQGLSQVVACKQAGASNIIVSGTGRDAARLELAMALGADHVIDIVQQDPREAVMDLTGGVGVDVVLDCTAGAGTAPILLGVDVLRRRGGTMVVQGELAAFPDFPLKLFTEKAAALRSARGHSYLSCELALKQLASGRAPLERLATHSFGLDQVDEAIRTVAGETGEDAIHVTLLPWDEAATGSLPH